VFGTPVAAYSGGVIYANTQSFVNVHTDGPKTVFSSRLANRDAGGFAPFDSRDAGHTYGNLRRGLLRRLCLDCSTAATRVCAACLPGSGLHLDPRLLGMEPSWRLLLGARRLGATALRGRALDPGILGLVQRRV